MDMIVDTVQVVSGITAEGLAFTIIIAFIIRAATALVGVALGQSRKEG